MPIDLSKLSGVVKTDFVKKDAYNAKIKNIEDKILDITDLATNASLTAVENKIPNVSSLVEEKLAITQKLMKSKKKNTDHNYDNYIATQVFNTLEN